MALSDTQIRAAQPGSKIVKLSDGGGVQLWISPDGAKRWRLAYRFDAAQKALAIGVCRFDRLFIFTLRSFQGPTLSFCALGIPGAPPLGRPRARGIMATSSGIKEPTRASHRRQGKRGPRETVNRRGFFSIFGFDRIPNFRMRSSQNSRGPTLTVGDVQFC